MQNFEISSYDVLAGHTREVKIMIGKYWDTVIQCNKDTVIHRYRDT